MNLFSQEKLRKSLGYDILIEISKKIKPLYKNREANIFRFTLA
jgi:hypothetical protein